MYNQEVKTLAARSVAVSRTRSAWVLSNLFPALFLLCLLALTFFSAPEHDDFCFADLNARHGFFETVSIFYHSISGRIVALVLTQFPPAIAAAAKVDLLWVYSLTLAVSAVLFVLAALLAMSRAWPGAGVLQVTFLGLLFASAVISAAPSLRELLYWLAGLACYVPAGAITILVLGECVRALDTKTKFSGLSASLMALGGFVAGLSNEFTGLWLLLIVATSLIARQFLGQPRQIASHGLIAAVIAVGWLIVMSAGGNSARMGQFPNGGHILSSLFECLRYALIGLGRFLREPAIIVALVAAGAITLAGSESARPASRDSKLLALGVVAICLACCYFEYFVHQFATGLRLIERAQNEALILLLFGSMLSVRLLVNAYRIQLRDWFSRHGYDGLLGPVALPTGLAVLAIVSLSLGSTASLLRQQRQEFYPYWQESVARHQLLTTNREPVLAIPRHKSTPSLIMSSDVTADASRLPNDCIARYYGKSAVYAAD